MINQPQSDSISRKLSQEKQIRQSAFFIAFRLELMQLPYKKLKPCNYSGCDQLTDEVYCKDHKIIKDAIRQETHSFYNRHRSKDDTDFYKSKEWKKTSNLIKIRDLGLCQQCKREGRTTFADMVHHKIPLQKRWDLRLDWSNLESLCIDCHNKIDHTKL